jgi:hypothetical protein
LLRARAKQTVRTEETPVGPARGIGFGFSIITIEWVMRKRVMLP